MSNNNNPNQYPGATVSLVGWAAGPARAPRYDKDGSSGVLELSIPLNEGYKKDGDFVQTGTTWYTYSAVGEYAEALKKINKGDKIRIDDAKQEVREYEVDGVKQKAISLRYGNLQVLEAKDSGSSDGFAPDAGAGAF